MLRARTAQRGFNLIEVMITLAVIGVLLTLGAPAFSEWLQNQQIRAAAEATLNGLQVARAEAVRSNAPVRFQFVSDLTSSCTLASTNDPTLTPPTQVNLIVSAADPTGLCDAAANPDTTNPANNPWIFQKRYGGAGFPNARVTAVFEPSPPAAPTPTGASTVTFGGLGNVIANADGTPSIVRIDVDNPIGSSSSGRPLRIVVSGGGSTKMCDPVLPTSDPRSCPAFP